MCNSRFTCVTRLSDHYGRQQRDGKKYQCDKCKRIFYTQRLLQSHLRSHTHIYRNWILFFRVALDFNLKFFLSVKKFLKV